MEKGSLVGLHWAMQHFDRTIYSEPTRFDPVQTGRWAFSTHCTRRTLLTVVEQSARLCHAAMYTPEAQPGLAFARAQRCGVGRLGFAADALRRRPQAAGVRVGAVLRGRAQVLRLPSRTGKDSREYSSEYSTVGRLPVAVAAMVRFVRQDKHTVAFVCLFAA